jgi:ribokinase
VAKILVVGSSNTDLVVKTARFPRPGETLIGGNFFLFQGGKGANQAVAAARMGGEVTFISKVGKDLFGQQTKAGLQQEGISTEWVWEDLDQPSGIAIITVNKEGENQIIVAPGANGNLLPNHLSEAISALHACDFWLCQLEIPLSTVSFLATKAKEWGKQLVLNPAPAQKLDESVYHNLFLITPNETEASLLTGKLCESEADYVEIADWFEKKGVLNVLITLGEKGVFFKNSDLQLLLPAPKVPVIDTTAAGDVFNGTLSVFLAEGMPWENAIQTAINAASLSVARMGAQFSAPFRNEVL